MNTTKKIALSCTIGGAICAFVAVMVNPTFWWLGTIAGFGGGYLAYEFKKVLKEIPEVWKDTFGSIPNVKQIIVNFFKEEHPYIYPCIILSIIGMYILFPHSIAADLPINNGASLSIVFAVCLVSSAATSLFTLFMMVVLQAIGTDKKKGDSIIIEYSTYKIVYSEIKKGFFIAIYFLLVMWWIKLISFGSLFIWKLFKLIHSDKRLLCGIDSALGGTVSYFLFSPANSIIETIMIVVFGGLMGGFLGIINWEIVSKRILKVQIKT